MRRTQLYLDDDLWRKLHAQARRQHTTISDLVRQAIRDRYAGNLEERKKAMRAVVGLWKDRSDIADSTERVRELRKDSRLQRLHK